MQGTRASLSSGVSSGVVLGRYELLARMPAGGLGEVWRVHDRKMGRHVALKFLPRARRDSPTARRRLVREGRAAAALSHRNIVTVYDLHQEICGTYVAMEFIDGPSLDELVRSSGPQLWRRAAGLTLEAARGLRAAHAAGIVHRDIKPANVMLRSDGVLKIVDFGLARAGFDAVDLTTQGTLIGTPAFMSPEQCAGLPADKQSDLYSLVCTLFFLVTGDQPYEGSLEEILRLHRDPDPAIVERLVRRVPLDLAGVVRRGLQTPKPQRFQDCDELIAALRQRLTVSTRELPTLKLLRSVERSPTEPDGEPRPPMPRETRGTQEETLSESWRCNRKENPRSRARRPVWTVAVLLAITIVAGFVAWGVRGVGATARSRSTEAPMVVVPAGDVYRGLNGDGVTLELLYRYRRLYERTALDRGLDATQRETFVRKSMENVFELLNVPPRSVNIAGFRLGVAPVTNDEYRRFLEASGREHRHCHPDEPEQTDHTPAKWQDGAPWTDADRPVTAVHWFDAYAYARWRGCRLPTVDEWEYAARGSDGRSYPWGDRFDAARFTNQGDVPPPVNRLPSDPRGLRGLGDGVHEWTGTIDATGQAIVKGSDWQLEGADLASLTFVEYRRHRNTVTVDRGFRIACEPDGELEDTVPIAGGAATLGGESTPAVGFIRAHTAENFVDLLLGTDRPVSLPAFAIDRHEVTNEAYAEFLDFFAAGGDHRACHADEPAGKDHTPEFWDDPRFNEPRQPVVGVDWFDAYAYARWRGKRLPTPVEWERAARGDTRRLYPWGDTFDPANCVSRESGPAAPLPVDVGDPGASSLGVTHLCGNVMEWTAAPQGLDAELAVYRGGAWTGGAGALEGAVHFANRLARRTVRLNNVGFRCARDR